MMTDEQMRDLVKESGLDWHRGHMPLFNDDHTNRYAVLIESAMTAERHATRQRIIDACGSMLICPCCTGQFSCADDCTFSDDCQDEANSMQCLRDAVRA